MGVACSSDRPVRRFSRSGVGGGGGGVVQLFD